MQRKSRSKLYIGTSGWVYSHWDGIFYPEGLSSKDKLKFFSQHFKTAEINYSFYHLPRPATYQNWYTLTPDDFLFAVKASRFITHIKRLKGVKSAWETFIKNALNLKEKLGPILFQFPPSFHADEENIERLENFLEYISKRKMRYAFEFRHQSWFKEKVYKILKKSNSALVIADSPKYPKAEILTADFVYVRMHGSKQMFASKYTKKELKELADKIRKWQKTKDVFVYFNNDVHGFAIDNAKELKSLLEVL